MESTLKEQIGTGVQMALPLTASVVVYGAVFGVLAREAGLTLLQGTLMSVGMYAGSAQLVSLELWGTPLPVVTIVATAVLVNLRHVLFGMSLYPWVERRSGAVLYGSAFMMVDGSWALAMSEFKKGGDGLGVMLGAGGSMYLAWIVGTVAGMVGGGLIRDPARWGLDFLNLAALVALLCTLTEGKRSIWSWTVAAGIALLSKKLLPGEWYIVLGGIAGSLTGGLLEGGKEPS